MEYSGPINLDALIDLDSLAAAGATHYTLLAFPISTLDEHGLAADPDAQDHIGAVQSSGIPIGIWLNSPTREIGYAAVTSDRIAELNTVIASLTRFPDSYAVDLCERMFRDFSQSDQ